MAHTSRICGWIWRDSRQTTPSLETESQSTWKPFSTSLTRGSLTHGCSMGLARMRPGSKARPDGHVVVLGGAAGEDDFVGISIEKVCDLFAGVFKGLASFLPGTVATGGIGRLVEKIRPHRFPHRLQNRGAGAVIQIDRVHQTVERKSQRQVAG